MDAHKSWKFRKNHTIDSPLILGSNVQAKFTILTVLVAAQCTPIPLHGMESVYVVVLHIHRPITSENDPACQISHFISAKMCRPCRGDIFRPPSKRNRLPALCPAVLRLYFCLSAICRTLVFPYLSRENFVCWKILTFSRERRHPIRNRKSESKLRRRSRHLENQYDTINLPRGHGPIWMKFYNPMENGKLDHIVVFRRDTHVQYWVPPAHIHWDK